MANQVKKKKRKTAKELDDFSVKKKKASPKALKTRTG